MFEKLNSSIEPVFVENCGFIFYDFFVVPYNKFCSCYVVFIKVVFFIFIQEVKMLFKKMLFFEIFFINSSSISHSNIRVLPYMSKLFFINIFH